MKTFDEIREGVTGAVAGGVAGGLAGGPAGAAAGAYLGHKIQQAANSGKKKKDPKPTTIGPDGKQKTSEGKEDFKPHMMYDPKTGKGYMAKKYEDHLAMKKKGYSHDKPDVKEQAVNELDTSTLISYRKKANKQRYSNNISKRTQRTAGVDRADKKLRKRNIDKFGDHSPKGVDRMGNRKEDSSDAVKAFLAKGGKIKKLPPGKAQGYHGKDDPGKDVHGVMSRPDTKQIGTRKKVKSMARENYQVQAYKDGKKAGPAKSFGGNLKKATAHASAMKKAGKGDHRVHKEATRVDEISKNTAGSYVKKASDDMSKQSDRMARAGRNDGKMDKAASKFVNRRKGIARAVSRLTK